MKRISRVLVLCLLIIPHGLPVFALDPPVRVEIRTVDGRNAVFSGTAEDISGIAKNFSDKGDYQSAKLCYLKLIEINPLDVRSHILLGQLNQFQLGKYADAVKYYKKAEYLIPNTNPRGKAYVRRLLAEAYRELGEKTNSLVYFVQAIDQYQRVLDVDPDNVEALYYLGTCRLNAKDYETAIEIFKAILVRFPKSEWVDISRKTLAAAEQEKRRNK